MSELPPVHPVPPVPSWWHPPLALPALTKEEVVEQEAEEAGKEPGVTPPLMSPLASPMSGMVSPFPPGLQPGGVMDPRHLLHLLARKVR